MRDQMKPAIDALLVELGDQEKQVIETKLLINRPCARSQMEPMFPDAAASASSGAIGTIRPDSFYGKVLNTAAREYLEMRGIMAQTPQADAPFSAGNPHMSRVVRLE